MKAITDFINYLATQERSQATCKSYGYDLNLFVTWFAENNHEKCRLARITPTDLRLYKKYLTGLKQRPSTINRKLISLSVFLAWAFHQKRIKYRLPNPKPLRSQQHAPQWLSRTEHNQLGYTDILGENRHSFVPPL